MGSFYIPDVMIFLNPIRKFFLPCRAIKFPGKLKFILNIGNFQAQQKEPCRLAKLKLMENPDQRPGFPHQINSQ
jgi:hypothetical protein